MSTTHQALSALITRNKAVDESTNRLSQYLVQRALPNIAYAAADQAVAGTTLAASTYLVPSGSVGFNGGFAVVGGRTYQVEAYLATAVGTAGGIKVNLAAGTAAATNVQLSYQHFTATAVATTDSALLATTAGAATTGVIAVRISGTFTATSSGSLGLNFAEFAAVTTATVKKGSWLSITEIAQ